MPALVLPPSLRWRVSAAATLTHLQKDLESLPVTQVVNSPPPPPPPPAKHMPPSVTPGTHVTHSHHSHDHAGNLSLAYSNNLSYSQVDLGETQADAALFGLTQFDRPGDPVLMTTSELDLEMVRGTPEGDPPSPSSSPSPSPPPEDPAGHNPLAHMPFSSRMPMSLAQMFDVASSPRRPLAAGTSLPPTPSAAGATRLMARALSRMPSNLLPPTALEEEEGEEEEEEETTPMGSPTQANVVRAYVPMQESQEAHERESRKRRGRRRAPFGRSVSPVVFSSSFAPRPREEEQESEDEMVSEGEEMRRRADRARRKGDEEVKRLFMAVKGGRVENTGRGKGGRKGRARSEDASVGKTSRRGAGRAVAALKRRQTKSASPASEDTGDEEEAEAPAVARTDSGESLTVSTEEDDVSLPMDRPLPAAYAKPFASNAPEKQHSSALQYTQLLPQAWESLHQVPIAAVVRRTRPNPTTLRHESSALSERPPSRGYTATSPGSIVADSQQLPPPGPQKTWLRSLPPFNIPSPPHRTVPEFVRETSGLVAPEMTSSPAPLRTMVPETSPCREEAAGKRKRRFSPGEDRVPCSVEETRGFGAMEAAAGFLSSRPEPDDVDMLEIVADVGAGRDLEGMGVTPRAGRVERRRSTKRVKVTPKPVDVARLGSSRGTRRSKSKSLIRKTRSSVGLGVVAVPDTPTPVPVAAVSAAAAAAMDTDDDEADVLVSKDPAFSLSVAPPPPPLVTAVVAPERVFALFRDGRNSYHPATVKEGDPYMGTVRVVFDDGTEDLLERVYVRALDLRVGDCVKVDIKGMKKVTWEVQGFADSAASGKYSDCRGHTTVLVKARKTAGAGAVSEAAQVQVTNIYLVKSMWKEFNTRVYRGLPATLSLPLSQVRNATPSGDYPAPTTPPKVLRHTPISGSLSRTLGGGMFAGMVFALSFGDKESVKKAIAAKILQNGGRIVDVGFEELFYNIDRSTGTTTTNTTTTTTTAASSFSSSDTTAITSPIHFTPRPETNHVGFAAVIADAHSRRAKFLQALALGLPCLAPRWVEDCCKRSHVVDWEHYLLPAGESRYLGTVRSRVLERYDARTAWMRVVVAKRERLLQGRGVVVVAGGGARACERRVWTPPLLRSE